jgi:hypothetical protein
MESIIATSSVLLAVNPPLARLPGLIIMTV